MDAWLDVVDAAAPTMLRVRWATTIPGEMVPVVVSDSQGNVYATNYRVRTWAGSYITKRDAATGSDVWTKAFRSTDIDSFAGIPSIGIGPNDDLYVVINVRGHITFDGVLLGPFDASQALLIKLTLDGHIAWTRRIGDASWIPSWPTVDSAGRVFFVGSNATNQFLEAYDADGTHAWTRAIAQSLENGSPWLNHLAIDPNGDLLVVGGYTSPVSLGGELLPETPIAATFVARFDRDGAHLDSRRLGPSTDSTAAQFVVTYGERTVVHQAEQSETTFRSQIRVHDASLSELWSIDTTTICGNYTFNLTVVQDTLACGGWIEDPDKAYLQVVFLDQDGNRREARFGSRIARTPNGAVGVSLLTAAPFGALVYSGSFDGIIALEPGQSMRAPEFETGYFIAVTEPL